MNAHTKRWIRKRLRPTINARPVRCPKSFRRSSIRTASKSDT
jgi:hypothetical protein